jgi:Tat protein translocase TatB subunit
MPSMFGMGMGEILLIAVVALLVVGPDRLPSAAKAIGKGIRDLRASTKDLQSTIEQDTQIGEAVRELKGALRGDPETLYKRATGEDFHAPPKETGESKFPKDPRNTLADGKAEAGKANDEAGKGNDGNDEAGKGDDEAKGKGKGHDEPRGDDEAKGDDDAKGDDPALPTPDKELGELLDQAYANSNDPWGTEAVNPHEVEAEPEPDRDPDLPAIRQPAGAVARSGASADESGNDDNAGNDDPKHG